MSLLMEALKKAEEAKRQANTQPAAGQAAFPSLELPPLSESVVEESLEFPTAHPSDTPPSLTQIGGRNPMTPRHSELPELPGNMDTLDSEFLSLDAAGTTDTSKIASSSPVPLSNDGFSLSIAPETDIPLARPGHGKDSSPQGDVPESAQLARGHELSGGVRRAQSPEQAAAHNLFDAKQPSPPSRKNFLVALGLFVALSVVSIGIYFWLQLQPKSGLALMTPATPPQVRAAIPAPTPVAPLPPSAPPPGSSEVRGSPEPVPQTAIASPATPQTVDEEDKPQVKAQPAHAPSPVSAPPANMPVKITMSKLRVDPSLENGYEAFQQGNLPGARSAYETALKNDPNSVDALNGLAMTLMRSGRSDLAEAYFQKALEVDPRNSLAQASLSGLHDTSDPVQAESRLKLALSEQPDASHLHFALGNLYARQNRWADAQQAYFRAMSGDPENPDYLFNLAVSLDRLHQVKLAARYYTQAVAAAQKHPAGFDPVQVNERIKKLQP